MNKFNFSALVTLAVMAGVAFSACNSEGFIRSDATLPVITLDNEYGVYTAKPGQEITIAPTFDNVVDADIVWTIDGHMANTGRSWTTSWEQPGEYYVTITATNRDGSASEDIRIDVLEAAPPVISLALPDGGLRVAPGTGLLLKPEILNSEEPGFEIEWTLDGVTVGHEPTYTFSSPATGLYHMEVTATNADGSDHKEFDITVSESGAVSLQFMPLGYNQPARTLYCFAGQKIVLQAVAGGVTDPQYSWTVNDRPAGGGTSTLSLTPAEPGEYRVSATISGPAPVTANISVVCVAGVEADRYRPGSGDIITTVMEWLPAPGQFINDDSSSGGMSGTETTSAAANAWAQQRLHAGLFVSLGAWGGYLTVGFDHSIAAGSSGYDFAIRGNAFQTDQTGNNEPGIVWVMQDTNGNGLPDDCWYQLAGSEYGKPATLHTHAITYYRPAGPGMPVQWTAANGESGTVNYIQLSHRQDYYYPAWVTADSYTLWGTRLEARTAKSPASGQWVNPPFDYGYADNIGSDNLTNGVTETTGQLTGFRIADAVHADGTPARLQYIDFVKVQTGVQANAGVLGEVSTEVCGFTTRF